MCLSTVYKDEIREDSIISTNVKMIECKDNCVHLTDILGRVKTINGKLVCANLVDGVAIVNSEY